MRLKIAVLLGKILLLASGTALLGLALFANQLGIDHDPTWGRGRILLALCGAACFLIIGVWQFGRLVATQPLFRRIAQMTETLRSVPIFHQASAAWQVQRQKVLRIPLVRYFQADERRGLVLATGSAVAITLFVYLWYITSGTLTTWTPYTDYFDKLGCAFRAGQLALLEKPPAELMALKNPYDWRTREGIGFIWDTSYYQGQYYLYWGPVPGLLAALMKVFAPVKVEDQHLLFLFCCGQVICFALILGLLRQRLIRDLPLWALFLFILLGGLSIPALWLINRPSVYETAIAGGQCFLLLGCYAVLRAFLRPHTRAGWLVLGGLAWGAAVGCRTDLVIVVVYFTALVGIVLLRQGKGWRKVVQDLLWLSAPLSAWAAGLGWYNAARFGSIFETGHRYQLTGPALPADYRWVLSIQYVIPNLYNYLVRPLAFSRAEFPFVFAPFIQEKMWPFFIRLPEHYYYSEPVAGIFTAVPALLLMLIPGLGLLRCAWDWLNEQPPRLFQPGSDTIAAVWGATAGGFLLLLGLLALFISSSMRYLADIIWLGTLLAALGFWYGLGFLRRRPLLKNLLSWITVALVILSISFGLLGNFTNGDQRFAANNPELYAQIVVYFQGKP
jgi:hypothetical protein